MTRWLHSREAKGLGYAAPTLAFVALFFVTPLVMVLWMSANRWPLLRGRQGVNLPNNFTSVRHNELVSQSIGFTVKYTILVTIALMVVAMLLALLVQSRRRGVGLFRTAFFVPSVLGLASASFLFYGLYSPSIGPLNSILRQVGLASHPVSWLGSPNSALYAIIALIVWKFAGFYMLILMVGLQGIPIDIYEAARVDGASRWQSFWKITVPLLRPTIALMLILSITGSLVAFDQFYILTPDSAVTKTVTVVIVIFREAFTRQNLGTAAALSVVVLLVLLILNALQFRGLRGKSD
jgi:multiple sugar transport system permease protein